LNVRLTNDGYPQREGFFLSIMPISFFSGEGCWRIGVLAYWRIGVLAYWRIGVLAYWRIGVLGSGEVWGQSL
jgi:hypothetical protein